MTLVTPALNLGGFILVATLSAKDRMVLCLRAILHSNENHKCGHSHFWLLDHHEAQVATKVTEDNGRRK